MTAPNTSRAGAGKASASSGHSDRLSGRHIQFIAIGGAIGAGLFLGSGEAVQRAGPVLLVAYVVCGVIMFFIGRALGELALHRPEAGSFTVYADDYLGPWIGFLTGWSYWLNWILVGTAEVTAVGLFARFWFPDLPQWLPALFAVIALFLVNVSAVRIFGELEFWLAAGKVLTILTMIAAGSAVLIFHVGPGASHASLANLWTHGGFSPNGVKGFLAAIPITLFAFGGIEVIGMTAADADQPEKTIPRAINGVAVRILVFYIGSLLIIMSIVPWTQLNGATSPYVLAFSRIGLPAAAQIINLVVITAVLSACNSGLYATGRSLQGLATTGHAPAYFRPNSANGQPVRAICASAGFMLIGVLLNYLVPGKIFGWIMSAVAVLLVWIWLVIVMCHLAYRRRIKAGLEQPVSFRMPGAPVTNWIAGLFLVLIIASMTLDLPSRITLGIAGAWFALLSVAYLGVKRRLPHGANIKAFE